LVGAVHEIIAFALFRVTLTAVGAEGIAEVVNYLGVVNAQGLARVV
jgi:hypothetical protein